MKCFRIWWLVSVLGVVGQAAAAEKIILKNGSAPPAFHSASQLFFSDSASGSAFSLQIGGIFNPVLVLKADGSILLNGVQIETLSSPEIKEQLSLLVKAIAEGNRGDSLVQQMSKQTDIFLGRIFELEKELARCKESATRRGAHRREA